MDILKKTSSRRFKNLFLVDMPRERPRGNPRNYDMNLTFSSRLCSMETLTKVSEGKRDEYETCVRLGDAPRTPSPQLRGLTDVCN